MLPDLIGMAGKRAEEPRSKKKGDTPPSVERGPDALPLVEEDGLFFQVTPDCQGGPAGRRCDPAVIAGKFRVAFASVWGRIPLADRERLLAYWRRTPEPHALRERPSEGRTRPLIRVACGSGVPDVDLAGVGTIITFAAPLILGERARLEWEIARALAQCSRLASGEHWKLVVELIEEPLARWERQEGARATDTRRDRKLDALEAEYLRRFEASMGRILQRWKVSPASP